MLTSTALTPGHQPVPGTCVPSKVGNRVWPLKDAEYQPGVVGGVGGGGGGGSSNVHCYRGYSSTPGMHCSTLSLGVHCTCLLCNVLLSSLNFFSLKSLEGELQCGPLAQQWVLAP